MPITISQRTLSDALSACQRVTPSRTPKEILKNVRLSFQNATHPGQLVLSASDGELSIRLSVSVVEVLGDPDDESFDVLADPRLISRVLGGSSSANATLSVDGTTLIVNSDGVARIETEDVKDFPPDSQAPAEYWGKCDAATLKHGLNRTVVACDPESTRYALGGVLFDPEDNKLNLAATDSRVLVVSPVDVTVVGEWKPEKQSVLPHKSIKALLGVATGEVSIVCTDNSAHFTGDGWSLSTQLVQGRFPDYRKVIPEKSEFSVTPDASVVMSAVSRAEAFTTAESRAISLAFEPGVMTIISAKDRGGYKQAIPVEDDCGTCVVNMDPKILAKAIGQADSTIEMRIIDAESAIVVIDGETTVVAMPLSSDA